MQLFTLFALFSAFAAPAVSQGTTTPSLHITDVRLFRPTEPPASAVIKPKYIDGVLCYSTLVTWSGPAPEEMARYELKLTFTDDDTASDFTNSEGIVAVTEPQYVIHRLSISNIGFLRIRAISKQGLAGPWTRYRGVPSAHFGLPKADAKPTALSRSSVFQVEKDQHAWVRFRKWLSI